MKREKIFSLACLFYMICSCGNNFSNETSTINNVASPNIVDTSMKVPLKSPPSKNAFVVDSIYEQRDSILYNEKKMVMITTWLNDAVAQGETHQFDPAILKQEFIFYNGGKIVSQQELPSKKVTQKINSGKKQEMLENVTTEIGVIEGTTGILFTFQGWGGCGNCTESFGLFSTKGELQYFYCGTRGESNYKKIGNQFKVLKNSGIADSTYINHKYKSSDLIFGK